MIALTAVTVSHVIVREALGVGAARIRDQARIHTVVILAGLIERALAVVLALDGVARDFWVALIALLAGTNRFVIPYVADRVSATVARIATLPVDASLAIAAIVVRRTRSNDCQLYCKIGIK